MKAESGGDAKPAAEPTAPDHLRLLEYGFLGRSPHPAGVMVSITGKALWVLSFEG
ncbi:hypothetical protein [Infirmifilum sp. SLHALR2]